MANMFSGNQEKRIPKSFKECYQTDDLTKNLWLWCERVETWGFVICIILGIIGIISIISNGVEMSRLIDEFDIDPSKINALSAELGMEIKSVFEVVVDGILEWCFYCFLEYCTYHIIALLIGSLATIVQHTKITANINLLRYAEENNIIEDKIEIKDGKTIEKFYNVKLIDAGNDEILIRNEISKHAKTTLSNAQKIIDKIPNAIFKFKSIEQANDFCNNLRSFGATVELIEGEKLQVDVEENDEKFIKTKCPYCMENLEFLVGTKDAQCPYCNKIFKID